MREASAPALLAYALVRVVDAEAQWIVQVQTGDVGALKSLYAALGRNVFALALRMLGSREDAEEVVQDTFVKVHDKADSFDSGRGSARAWIYTIARNESRMRLRSRSSRPVAADAVDLHDPTSAVAAPQREASPVDRLTVNQAFENLDPDEVRLLEDAFFSGYSHSEIAEREATPVGTIKSRIRRAMLKARAALGGDA